MYCLSLKKKIKTGRKNMPEQNSLGEYPVKYCQTKTNFIEQYDYSSRDFYDNKHPKPKNPFVT